MTTQERTITAAHSATTAGLVDVVVPCFNDGSFLLEALESLGAGSPRGEGIVVVNDGSTDRVTLQVLEDLRKRGFTVIDRQNGGLSSARNAGWRSGSAPYVLFLDADNRVEPGYAAKAAALMEQDPAVDVVYSDKREFGEREGIVIQPDVDLAAMLVGNRIDACAVVRRTALEICGGYDEDMRDGYEDWELWIRLMSQGHRFAHIGEPLFHYRVREGSLLSRADDPDKRGRIVDHVVRKHAALFTRHIRAVVSELHRIQAHDRMMVYRADQLALEAGAGVAMAEQAARSAADALAAARTSHEREMEDWHRDRSALESGMVERDQSLQQAAQRAEETAALHASAQRERDALAAEAHRLVGEVDKAMRTLEVHREHSRSLQALLTQYGERIRAIENSRLWRIRRGYHKLRTLLRAGSGSGRRGFKWLRRITFLVSRKGRRITRSFLAKVFRALYLWTETRPVRIVVGDGPALRAQVADHADPYAQWMAAHFPREADLAVYRDDVAAFSYKPLISIVMPVYETPEQLLNEAIASVVAQVYPNWELCIADDRSPSRYVRTCLEHWAAQDARIRLVFRSENGHISKASNSALELAGGEFVALMDHDDLLAPDALFHVVRLLNRNKDLDLIYTDEDKIDEKGIHSEPHFKPQWCPDHLLSRNYLGHLVVMRTAAIRSVGGFRPGFEGSQDYDLILRVVERILPDNGMGHEGIRIARVPRVLYHWRIHAGSAAHGEDVKPYAYDAAKRALTEALDRRGEPAKVTFLDGFRGYGIRFTSELQGKVSVIIPTHDKAEVLGTCLRSLFRLTDHPDMEVIVVSNNSRERELFELLETTGAEHPGRFRWIKHDIPFNFSALMNEGVRHANGSHILFLNNDTEITHADWLRAMHEQSQRRSIGAVGAKLLYHNDTVQHAGVIIGLGGVAGHAFTGTHRDGPGYFNYVNTINNYSAVTAACMMVERAKLDAVGGWEERFTVEYNDVDLCLRLREHGWNNVYLPHVELYHHESLTRGHPHMTRTSYERHVREVSFFQERWKKYIDDDPCYDPNLSRGRHDWHFHL